MPSSIWKNFEDAYTPEPNSGCWLWNRRLSSDGYGGIKINGKEVKAHRASFNKYRGEIPEKMQVLHRCDMPACVNPDHLFLGTHADNMRDMAKKKRWFSYPSAEHPSARLTEDAVRAIRASSENYAALGRRYGVHKHTIYLIRSRKTWRNLA